MFWKDPSEGGLDPNCGSYAPCICKQRVGEWVEHRTCRWYHDIQFRMGCEHYADYYSEGLAIRRMAHD